nr:hypothetical protein GCM10020185_13890 [Pseudomonas brassicacearum subsp. brassicacearum]
MHHRFDIQAQIPGQQRVAQIPLDKLCTATHQVLHALGPATVDPYIQALLQGETREAPADEAARAGDQNFS